ncbi:MAG: hypothetical protein JWM72_890, partial [Actinomycetia bacterium]|nr:hypothetical protein [Actinomycetes bacterium]
MGPATRQGTCRRPGRARLATSLSLVVLSTSFLVGWSRPAIAESDTQAPQLLSLSFSPPSVDVSSGAAVVVVSARMTDDLSGVATA